MTPSATAGGEFGDDAGRDQRIADEVSVDQALLDALRSSGQVKEELLQLAYPELRRIARRYLLRERPGHTLQPTALVHEAYLRMIAQSSSAENSAHFVALAAQMMRRILINHALSKKAEKRGGGQTHIPLDDDLPIAEEGRSVDVLALDEALTELEALDPRQAKIVELRYFGGLSIEETAGAMSISTATVKRDWLTAKLWLRRRLSA
ncbi:sigma-70 family RNA polymerase sigma factor [Variovorax paradoxus]|nr:sigma-70 family RNA polymerase sigma factor [Variovorax paradoxus]